MSKNRMIARRFQILDSDRDLIGRGGMGDVYRATDTQTGETVAVKALNPEIVTRNPELLERFEREGEALRQLNHPNIIKFVTAVEEVRCHYLVMEYVPGGSLEDLLAKQGHLDPTKTVEIALDDEMPGAESDIAQMVFDAVPGKKRRIELDGGHFGQIYYPSELFTQSSLAQRDFLLEYL